MHRNKSDLVRSHFNSFKKTYKNVLNVFMEKLIPPAACVIAEKQNM